MIVDDEGGARRERKKRKMTKRNQTWNSVWELKFESCTGFVTKRFLQTFNYTYQNNSGLEKAQVIWIGRWWFFWQTQKTKGGNFLQTSSSFFTYPRTRNALDQVLGYSKSLSPIFRGCARLSNRYNPVSWLIGISTRNPVHRSQVKKRLETIQVRTGVSNESVAYKVKTVNSGSTQYADP